MFNLTFEFGIWNAWILQVIYFVISMQPVVLKKILKGNIKEETDKLKNISPTNVRKSILSKIIYWLLFIIFIISFIVTFFLPLKLGTFLFYLGLFLFLIGIILIIFVIQSWIISVPNKPITKGIYRFSRHPMYISFFFSYAGIILSTMSIVFIILTIIHITLTIIQARFEEEFCIMKYGKNYKDYMKKTPRWLGIKK